MNSQLDTVLRLFYSKLSESENSQKLLWNGHNAWEYSREWLSRETLKWTRTPALSRPGILFNLLDLPIKKWKARGSRKRKVSNGSRTGNAGVGDPSSDDSRVSLLPSLDRAGNKRNVSTKDYPRRSLPSFIFLQLRWRFTLVCLFLFFCPSPSSRSFYAFADLLKFSSPRR